MLISSRTESAAADIDVSPRYVHRRSLLCARTMYKAFAYTAHTTQVVVRAE